MLVSVCLATYNGEKYIREQIESILKQLQADDELVITDDASVDNTAEIIRCVQDDRIVFIQNNNRLGVIKNFEKALKVARGEYIFLSDQDDVWLDEKLQTFLRYLQKSDIIVSDAIIVNAQLEVLHASFFRLKGVRKGLLRNFYKNNYMGCNMAFHRKVLSIALPFPDDIPMHDIWLGIIGELFFTTRFIPEKLNLYRRHSYNVSQAGSTSPFSLIQKIKFRINLLKYVPLLFVRKYFPQKRRPVPRATEKIH